MQLKRWATSKFERVRYPALSTKTRNAIVAGGLATFVFGVYYYTMRAVASTDELQVAIDKFEEQKLTNEPEAPLARKGLMHTD